MEQFSQFHRCYLKGVRCHFNGSHWSVLGLMLILWFLYNVLLYIYSAWGIFCDSLYRFYPVKCWHRDTTMMAYHPRNHVPWDGGNVWTCYLYPIHQIRKCCWSAHWEKHGLSMPKVKIASMPARIFDYSMDLQESWGCLKVLLLIF